MDAQLKFEITNQLINRVDTFKPVADSKNYLTAHFDFLTDEWTNTERQYLHVVKNHTVCY